MTKQAERRPLSVVSPPLDPVAVRAVIAHIDGDGEAGLDPQALIDLGLPASFVEPFVEVTRVGICPSPPSRTARGKCSRSRAMSGELECAERCYFGMYQMGDVHARSWVVIGTFESILILKYAASCAVQRGVGISITRA